MNRKIFADIKSKCVTKRQMKAFNELVKSFADRYSDVDDKEFVVYGVKPSSDECVIETAIGKEFKDLANGKRKADGPINLIKRGFKVEKDAMEWARKFNDFRFDSNSPIDNFPSPELVDEFENKYK